MVRDKKQIILSGIFDDLLEYEQNQSKEVVHTASGNPNIKKGTPVQLSAFVSNA